jgi:hypothetical protein
VLGEGGGVGGRLPPPPELAGAPREEERRRVRLDPPLAPSLSASAFAGSAVAGAP